VSEINEFFSTPEVTAHLDLIRHLIENSELVPLIRGAEGSGKSLLASRLQQMAPENWVVCHFSADATLQPERLLAFIARCSGLPDIAGELMQRLVDRFEVLRKRGKTPVLLVDDAQMLPPTSLITLLRLFERQIEGDRLVSIVLFADEQIDLLLSTPQLQVMTPQSIQAIDMPLLTRQEATGFMGHLLRQEGLSDSFALDESKLSRLYKESGGVPGVLANGILSEVGIQGEAKPTFLSGYRKQLLLIGVPVMLIIVLLLLFQGPINALFEPSVQAEADPSRVADAEEIILPLPAAVDDNPVSAPDGVIEEPETVENRLPVSANEAEQTAQSEAPPMENTNQAPMDAVGEEQVTLVDPVSMDYSGESLSDKQDAVAEKPVEQMPVLETAEVEKAPERIAQQVEPVAVSEPQVKEVIPERLPTEGETVALSNVSPPEATAAVEAEPIEQTTVVSEIPAQVAEDAAPPVEVKVKVDPFAESAAWVKSQPGKNYTLQLIAVENLDSLNRFINNNSLDSQVVTVKTLRKGVPWYALIWGSFANRDLALAAQTKLPAAVQKGGVWARSFASLQSSP
jgi:septal ring-binding cell division protein DamX/type II secretory pathway predicted ATPase ExeA